MDKTNKRKKRVKILLVIISFLFIFTTILGLVFIDNKNIDYEKFELTNEKVVNEEIKIAHLSDLHFPKIKIDVDKLIEKLIDTHVDIIAITGDLIDESAIVEQCGVTEFIDKIKDIAPIFYVNGNHETRNSRKNARLNKILTERGVSVLENKSVNIKIKDTELTLIGLTDDSDYDEKYLVGNDNAELNYKILLAHRPEKWGNYISQEKEFQPNLILTGHSHGGQFRFFGQGVVAPNQGFFPEFDGGSHKTADGNCTMIVSRGIGNSIIPFRFNNKPNVPIITIKN